MENKENWFPDETDYQGDKGLTSPTAQKQDSSEVGIIRELSPFKVLQNVRRNLKGFFWNPDTKEFEKLEGFEPLMNDTGISKYLAIMSSFLNDTTTFSSFKEEEIAQIVCYICDAAIPVIHINYKEYGVKNKSDLLILDNQIFMMAISALKKAVGGGDRNVIRGTLSENIMSRYMQQPGMEQQHRSFLSRLNPFARS